MTASGAEGAAPSSLDRQAAADQRSWLILAAATIAFGFGLGVNFGLVPSFAAEHLRLPPTQLGLLEALREVPGLLTAGIIALVAGLALPRLATLSLFVLGVGIALTGLSSNYTALVLCNVTWSLGLHVWLTVQPALILSLTADGKHGYGLGLMNRYSALAIMAGLLAVRLGGESVGYPVAFAVGGAAAAVGSWIVARLPRLQGGRIAERLVFRPRYWRYYLLMLLDGGRRQLVQTFAILILVREFSVGRGAVAVLLLVGSALTMLAAPLVGSWTDRLGERAVLSAYYSLVIVVFFAYTRIEPLSAFLGFPAAWCFYVIYALDHLLFTGSVGIQTYIRHTADPEDLSPSLAMGLTWNHLAAVGVPLVAGWIWARYGYEQIFLYGMGMALASVLMCLTLPRKEVAP